MPNASRVAAWLDATLYETDFRPVELRKYVRRGWELLNERREVERHLPDPTGCQESRLGALCSEDPRCKTEGDLTLAVLADESVLKGESILIFRGQKALTVETAKMMSKVLEVEHPFSCLES